MKTFPVVFLIACFALGCSRSSKVEALQKEVVELRAKVLEVNGNFGIQERQLDALKVENSALKAKNSELANRVNDIELALAQKTSEQSAAARAKSADDLVITGAVYVNKANGSSLILRNQLVSILKPSAIDAWNRVHKGLENSQTKGAFFEAHIVFLNESDKFEIVGTRTDIDGRYKFSKLPPGEYVVYSESITGYSTICWLVPVKLEDGKPVELDLVNSNARVIRNDR